MITLYEGFLSEYECEQYSLVSAIDIDMQVDDADLMDKLHEVAKKVNPDILRPEY